MCFQPKQPEAPINPAPTSLAQTHKSVTFEKLSGPDQLGNVRPTTTKRI